MSILKAEDGFNSIAVKAVRNAARLSSCRRRKVGAAMFNIDGTLIATGWNNEQPAGMGLSCMEGDCPRGMAPYTTIPADSPYGDCIAQHAEMMVLQKVELLTATDLSGPLDLILVVTHSPCHECTAVLEKLDLQVFYLEEL